MSDWRESPEAIGAVDALLASVGLEHGRRATRANTWLAGERRKEPRQTPVRAVAPPAAAAPGVAFGVTPGVERVPGWEQYPWLRAGFSTRQGGQSAVYGKGEQNLGWTREDDPAVVAGNRERFLAAVTGDVSLPVVTLHQVHSGLIWDLDQKSKKSSSKRPTSRETDALWMTPDGKARRRGDGLLRKAPGGLLGVVTADCVPVLVADTRTRAVAAFHAGWRGTLARIVERGIGSLQLRYGLRTEDLIAAIGPSIGACCFAVGEEVRFDFQSQFAYAGRLFSDVYDSDPVREKYPLLFLTARAPGHSNIGPQIHLDLVAANRQQLIDAGVAAARISVVGECTACSRLPDGARKYYSHRGEHGFAGRMLSVIGAVAS